MKKVFLMLILCITMSILLSSSAFSQTVVKMAIGEWAPFTSEADKTGKIAETIVTEAFKLEGIDVKYDYYPWKRSYELVKDGKADGTFPWTRKPDRENDFIINPTMLFKDDSVFFHLKTVKFDWNTIEDLKKYKVGVTIGFKEEKDYKEKGIVADAVPNEETNFKKMLEGKIEVYRTSKDVGYVAIKKLFSPEEAKLFTHHPKAAETSKYFILFSKATPNGKMFSEKFESGLKKLKQSGKYDKILAH